MKWLFSGDMVYGFLSGLFVVLLAVAVVAAGAADVRYSRLRQFDEGATVSCYCGGQLVFGDVADGLVRENRRGALLFASKESGRAARTFTDCIVTSSHPKTSGRPNDEGQTP